MPGVAKVGGVSVVEAAEDVNRAPEQRAARRPLGASGGEGHTVEQYADVKTLQRLGARLHELYADDRVRVVTDADLTSKVGRDLARKVERFYDWDAKQQAWSDPRPLEAPLTVAALSQSTFAALTGDASGSIGGFTTGPTLFVVPEDAARRNGPEDDVVVAHELGHVQDFREAGAGLRQVPIYLQEGKEYLLGDAAAMQGKRFPKNVYDVASALGDITAEDAALVMSDFRESKDEMVWGQYGFYGETIGALYLEFLRLHFKGGKRDALKRVAEVTTRVGRGKPFEVAFGEQFGATPKQSEDAFVKWVKQTEGLPFERLAGTLYDPRVLAPERELSPTG